MANKIFNVLSGKQESVEGVPPSETPEDVRLSEELLEIYDSERSQWAIQAKEDSEFRNNQQWKTSHKKELDKRSQSPIVDNVVYPAVEQAIALLTANKPRFQSTGREDSDTRTGRLFSDLMSYIWDVSSGNVELKQVIDDYYVRGMGVMQAYSDPHADFGKGEVFVKAINPLDVYIDPNSRDTFARDAAHIIVANLVTGEQLVTSIPRASELLGSMKRSDSHRYPDTDRSAGLDQKIDQGNIDEYHEHYELIDRYSKIKLPYYHIMDTASNMEHIFDETEFSEYLQGPAAILENQSEGRVVVTQDQAITEIIQLYQATGGVYHQMMDPQTGQASMMPGPEHEGAIPGSTTIIQLVTKADLLKSEDIIPNKILVDRIKRVLSAGGILIQSEVLDIDEYPLVTFMNRHNRNPFPMSDVRFVKPIQEYINKLTSLIIAHASSSTNTKLLIPRGSMDRKVLEEEWGRAGTGVIEFDPELGQPVVAGPIPLPNELYKNRDDAKQSIYQILGIHPLQSGDPTAAPQTYKGTVAIDEYAQRRIKSKLDDIDEALNQMAKVVVQLIQKTFSEGKIVRIMQPNNKPRELAINVPLYDDVTGEFIGRLHDVTVGKYDLVVVSGSTLPSNRWARFEYYMQLYEKGIIDQVEILKQTEVADAEGVLNRANQMVQMQGRIAELEEQLSETKGDLQTAQRESTHDRKRLEVEKFKGKLSDTSSRAEAAKQLFDARLGDEMTKIRQNVNETIAVPKG